MQALQEAAGVVLDVAARQVTYRGEVSLLSPVAMDAVVALMRACGPAGAADRRGIVSALGCELHWKSGRLTRDGRLLVRFTGQQARVLAVLMRNVGQPVAAGRLVCVGSLNGEALSRRHVDVVIWNIRKKLRAADVGLDVSTSWGFGWCLHGSQAG